MGLFFMKDCLEFFFFLRARDHWRFKWGTIENIRNEVEIKFWKIDFNEIQVFVYYSTR